MAPKKLTDKEKLNEARKSIRELKARITEYEKERAYFMKMMDYVYINRRSNPSREVFEQCVRKVGDE